MIVHNMSVLEAISYFRSHCNLKGTLRGEACGVMTGKGMQLMKAMKLLNG